MAQPKKGTLHQVMVPMVDSTDFASIESAITASDFNSGATVKFFGLNTGTSDATTSGTVSKIASLVRSGVFRITLKTSENNYDQMQVRINKTGCAEQIIMWENVTNDDSDLLSAITALSAIASDAHSAAAQANSRVVVLQSSVSDVQSAVLVVQSMASDAASAAQQGSSRALLLLSNVSDLQSVLSDFQSDFQSRVPKRVATDSQLSNVHSDLRSLVSGITATVSASDISDIASAVQAILASDLSDILSSAQQMNSRVLVVQSLVSDVDSAITSRFSDLNSLLTTTGVQLNASTLSDIRSAIADVSATVGASDISDIASAVRAILVSDLSDILSAAQQTNSRVLVVQSLASDIRSHVSDLQSDFQSRVPKLVATNSQLSDVHSDLKSAIGDVSVTLTASDISDIASAVAAAVTTITASDISDIASRVDSVLSSRLSDILSAAQQANSRILLTQSTASDIYSLLSDVQSDFQSRVPKRVATDSQLSQLTSDVLSALAAGVPVSASDLSDLRSAIAAGTLTASDISDIASAVAVALASNLSDVLSAAQQTNSRVLLNQSRVSDIYSLLSDLHSDVGVLSGVVSDVHSLVGALPTVSDIASTVLSAAAVNPIHANVKEINDVSLTGDGNATPWGPE